jgi:arginine-tRNA-protein transferase
MPSLSFSIRPGFKRFLVSTPLAIDESTGARTWAGDPDRDYKVPYGSYHQLYRIDGRLVAVRISCKNIVKG